MNSKMVILFLVLTMSTTSLVANISPVGTWHYEVPQAPYEYSTGRIVVEENQETYAVTLEANGQQFEAHNVSYENSQLTFTVYIENEQVTLDIQVSDSSMNGIASYSEGDLELTATRE